MIAKAAAFTLLLSIASSYASFLIPRPKGSFGTNVAVTALTDTLHLDPFAPKPENRSVVISAFYPVAPLNQCDWRHIPAYPKKSAAIFNAEVAFVGVPNGTFEKVNLEVCEAKASCQLDISKSPIVLFYPGLGLSRLWYSAIAQAVASYGFIVATVDQPYDADVVEFPDGRIIKAINSTWDEAESSLLVNVTAEEASFVLDELAKAEVVQELFPSQKNSLKGLATGRAGIFGHSIGGATAAMAMYLDSRFVGGVNLDGGLYGPVVKQGLEDPLVLFGHKSNGTSPTWIEIWPHLNWKLDIEILNSTHTTFTDIPLLASLIFGTPLPPLVQGIVGHVPGERARDVVTTYVAAFMEEVLLCKPQALLQRESPAYPEIEFDANPSMT
jgi:pimeloyl-ACP methyl ester carboxylesterase